MARTLGRSERVHGGREGLQTKCKYFQVLGHYHFAHAATAEDRVRGAWARAEHRDRVPDADAHGNVRNVVRARATAPKQHGVAVARMRKADALAAPLLKAAEKAGADVHTSVYAARSPEGGYHRRPRNPR